MLAVRVGADLELAPLVAAVVGGQEVLAARLDPLDRPLQHERQRRGDEVLVIGAELAAEAAADFRRDGAHLVLTQTEGAGDLVAEPVRPLVRGPDGEAARDRVGRGDGCRAVSIGIGMATRGADLGLHLDWRALASAASTSPWTVSWRTLMLFLTVVVELGSARLPRLVGIDDGLQRFVIDLDRGGGVCGLRLARGDHRGDRLADVAHLVPRQWLDPRDGDRVVLLRLRDVLLWRLAWTFVGLDRVLVGQHGCEIAPPSPRRRPPAWLSASAVSMPVDLGVGIRTAHDRQVDHAGEREVVDIDRGTGDQPRVFFALDRRADIASQYHFALLLPAPRPTAVSMADFRVVSIR